MNPENPARLEPVRIGILNISDRAAAGVYEDTPGRNLKELLGGWLATQWECEYRVVADDHGIIADALRELADEAGCCLVLTTGGTGPAPRDVTPEATAEVCERILPGFGEQMRAVSLHYVPTAILSRQIAGTRGRTLIVNLPGSPRAGRECLEAVFPAIPYCIELLGGPSIETLPGTIAVFRPQHAS